MTATILLVFVTVFYAGYNVFIKLSGEYVPSDATTTILAKNCIQIAALTTSVLFEDLV